MSFSNVRSDTSRRSRVISVSKKSQILGQIALDALASISPPIVSYFGYANFPHTLRNPPAAGCQSFDMPQLCNDFLGFMSLPSPILSPRNRNVFAWLALALAGLRLASSIPRTIPIPAWLVRCADFTAITASAGDPGTGSKWAAKRSLITRSHASCGASQKYAVAWTCLGSEIRSISGRCLADPRKQERLRHAHDREFVVHVSGTVNASTGSDNTDTEQLPRDSGECRVGLGVFAVTIRFRAAVRVLHERLHHPGAGK